MEVDKTSGEMIFKPGGIKWYIRHLDKQVFAKQLHTPAVFTKEVLEALDPIISDYFSYSSLDEMNQLNAFVEVDADDADDNANGIDVGDVVDEDLF